MESDKDVFPEFKLFNPLDRIKKIGEFLFGSVVHDYTSDHYVKHDVVTTDLTNRWDSMGNYFEDGEL